MANKTEKKSFKSVNGTNAGVPVGVKIISVLYYIAAVISILFGLLALIGSKVFAPYFSTLWPEVALSGKIAVLGAILIVFAALFFFIARGLWKGQKWARIVAIISAILGLVSAILKIPKIDTRVIANLIIHGLVLGYLLLSKKVRKAFA